MKNFTSHDILLVSFLLTKQEISLVEIKEVFPQQFIFVLSNLTLCENFSKDYLNNAPAPARELFSNREMLISEIKNRNKNGEIYGNSR